MLLILVVVSIAQPSVTDQPPVPSNVNVYDSSTGILTVKLYPGWNTLPLVGIYNPDPSKAINTCGTLNTPEFVKEGYIWSPVEGRYIGGSMEQLSDPNNPDLNIFYRERENHYYYVKEFGGIGFGYRAGSECSYTTWLGKRAEVEEDTLAQVLPTFKIAKGYNFLILHPWMQDRSIADFVGTCIITDVFLFDAQTQQWVGGSITQSDLESSFVTEESIGRIFIIKAANDCSFGLRKY